MSLKSLIQKLDQLNEGIMDEPSTKETPTGRIHQAKPGGYGRKDDEDTSGKKIKPSTAPKGRGRPKKNADSDTGEVTTWDASALNSVFGGKKPKTLPGKASVKHRIKDDNAEDIDEDLDPEQKKVGQLGPYDKVGKKGAVGKLVGANESAVKEALTYKQEHASWSVQSPKKNEFNTPYKLDKEKEARAHAERIGGKLVKVDQRGHSIRGKAVAEAEKNPHTSALGKALHRDLSKEKKASPTQVEKNKTRWAQRQAEREKGVSEGKRGLIGDNGRIEEGDRVKTPLGLGTVNAILSLSQKVGVHLDSGQDKDFYPEDVMVINSQQGIEEGIGDTIKRGVKSVKRGMAGWGSPHADAPGEIVKRNKGYDDKTVQRLNLRGKIYKDVDGAPDPHSPQGLQNRVLDREMKKRGLGEEGVAEGYRYGKAPWVKVIVRTDYDYDPEQVRKLPLEYRAQGWGNDGQGQLIAFASKKDAAYFILKVGGEVVKTFDNSLNDRLGRPDIEEGVAEGKRGLMGDNGRIEEGDRVDTPLGRGTVNAILSLSQKVGVHLDSGQDKDFYPEDVMVINSQQGVAEGLAPGQAAWKKEMTAKGAVSFKRDQHGGGAVDRIVAYDKDGKVVGGFNRKGVAEGFYDVVKGIKRKLAGKQDPKEVQYQHGFRARQAIDASRKYNNQAAYDNEDKMVDRYNKVHKVVNKGVAEGPDQIDELSKETMGSYIKKASKDIEGKKQTQSFGRRMAMQFSGPRGEEARQQKKIDKRHSGISTAVDKLTKEQGVAEGLSKRDQKDVDAIKAAIAGLEDKLKQPNADKEKIKQTIANEKKRLALYRQDVAEDTGQSLSIQQLAMISDEALDNAYHYGRSQPGNTFGWQANLKSASYAKQIIDRGVTDIDQISDAIHKGWNVTAKAFVQNPEQFDDTEKLKATGKLEAKLQQRAKLMNISYVQLPDDEQEKDRVVARALLQAINGKQGVAEGEKVKTKSGTIHKGTYGYGDEKDEITAPKGRGRPKKDTTADGEGGPKFNDAAKSFFGVGNIAYKDLPGKPGKKHKLKDWIEHIESNIITEAALDPSQVAIASVKAPGSTTPTANTMSSTTTQPVSQTGTMATSASTAKPAMGATVLDFKNPNDPLKAAIQQAVKNKQVTALGEEDVDEVITKATPAGEIIGDFQKSKNSKFAGKSKEERKRMALGAYYGMHPEKSKKEESVMESIDEGHMSEKLKDLLDNYPYEHNNAQQGWGLHENFYQALCDHYWKEGKIPRDIMYGAPERLREFVEECYGSDTGILNENPLLSMAAGAAGTAIGSAVADKMLGDSVQDPLARFGDEDPEMPPLSPADADYSKPTHEIPAFVRKSWEKGVTPTLPEDANLMDEINQMEEDYMSESKKAVGVKDAQMESWDKQLSAMLAEGLTITTTTDNDGHDGASVNATDADAQTLIQLLQNSGLMKGQNSSMNTQSADTGNATVTVEPVSADEVMGTLQPEVSGSEEGDDALGFLKRMLGAREEHSGTHTTDDSDQGDYEEEDGETCDTCGHEDCECDHEESEEEVEEGNAFSGAVAKAKADGIQKGETVTVGGKKYPVKEENKQDVAEGVASKFDPSMHEKIKNATPEELSQMAYSLGGDAYNASYELKLLQQAQRELLGPEGVASQRIKGVNDRLNSKLASKYPNIKESAASEFAPAMHERIKNATPEELSQMAYSLGGDAYNASYELKLLQQAQRELLGPEGVASQRIKGVNDRLNSKLASKYPKLAVDEGVGDAQSDAMAGLQRTIDFAKQEGYKVRRSPTGSSMQFIHPGLDHKIVAQVKNDGDSINVHFMDYSSGVSGNDDASYFDQVFKDAYNKAVYANNRFRSDDVRFGHNTVAEGLGDDFESMLAGMKNKDGSPKYPNAKLRTGPQERKPASDQRVAQTPKSATKTSDPYSEYSDDYGVYKQGRREQGLDESAKLDEWANSVNDSDEKFLADMTFMTKTISGGLNNIKQDQTVVPSARVKTQGETKQPDLTMAEMIRKLTNIN